MEVIIDANFGMNLGSGAGETLLVVAGAQTYQCSLRVCSPLGDDVDDTVDRIGAPEAGARSPDDFYAIDIFQ